MIRTQNQTCYDFLEIGEIVLMDVFEETTLKEVTILGELNQIQI